jgi:hypothetical protein
MADLNSLIAQGFQFKEPPDPFAQYAQMQQLQRGEETGRMNQMLMQEKQRGFQEQNALRGVVSRPGFDPMNPTHAAEAMAAAPTLAAPYIEKILTTRESRGKITAADIKAKGDKQSMLNQAFRDISRNPSDAQITAHMEDVLASNVFDQSEKDSVVSRANELLMKSVDERKAMLSGYGATAADLKPPTVARTQLSKLQDELAALPPNSPLISQYKDAIRKETQFAPQAVTTVQLPKQEGAFEAGVGAGQSKRIFDSQASAEGAARILESNDVGRSLLKSGAITGAGAEFLVGLNKALKQANIDFGYADAAANSQAYGAAMAANTGQLIKQFGAGTAISDADRTYATKAAAGEITMDEAAIRKVLDINDRAARSVINKHNKSVKGIKTNIPLEVEMPAAFVPSQGAAARIPGQAKPPRTVTRTGTSGGKKVIEYSDGSVEYAPG